MICFWGEKAYELNTNAAQSHLLRLPRWLQSSYVRGRVTTDPMPGGYDGAAWGREPPTTPDERTQLEAFCDDQIARAVVRGRERGHYYQLPADEILFNRPDVYQR